MNTRNFLLFILLIISQFVFGQVPQNMSYQAVMRDGEGNLLVNKSINLRVSIIKGSENGELVFEEVHLTNTNSNGLISIIIGNGEGNDDFSMINWGSDIFFMKTEIDPSGEDNFNLIGINQVMSVPYAIAAKTAETLSEPIEEKDPDFNAWDKNYDDLINVPTTITTEQAQAISVNSVKNSYPAEDANKLESVEIGAEVNVQANWDATEGDAMILNKPNIPDTKDLAKQSALEDSISSVRMAMFSGSYNDLSQQPTTITTEQAQAISANSTKNSYPVEDANKLSSIETGAEVNVQPDWNAAEGDAMILNKPNIPDTKDLAKQSALEDSILSVRMGMFSGSYNDLSQQPTTITAEQAQAISANSAKNNYPSEDSNKLNGIEAGAEVNVQSDWNATEGDAMILNKPTTISVEQTEAISANSTKNSYPVEDANKLSNIETGAEVNVQADWNATEGDAMILNKPNLSNTVQVISPAQGDLAYYDGTQWRRIAKGNNGQVLTMDNNAPAWQNENQSNSELPAANAENEGQFLMYDGEDYVLDPVLENTPSKLHVYHNLNVRGAISAGDNNISLSKYGVQTDVDTYFMKENNFHGNINLKGDKVFYFGDQDTEGGWKIVIEDGEAGESSKLVFYVHFMGSYIKVKEFQMVIN